MSEKRRLKPKLLIIIQSKPCIPCVTVPRGRKQNNVAIKTIILVLALTLCSSGYHTHAQTTGQEQQRSGKPLRQIIRDTKRTDFYLDVQRALEYGLIDAVLAGALPEPKPVAMGTRDAAGMETTAPQQQQEEEEAARETPQPDRSGEPGGAGGPGEAVGRVPDTSLRALSARPLPG